MFISHANGGLVWCKWIKSSVNEKTWSMVDDCLGKVVFAFVSFERIGADCTSGG